MCMYFTPNGNTTECKMLHNATTLSSNYTTFLKNVRRKKRNRYRIFTENWKWDFYFLGKQFLVDPEKLVDIIYDVSKDAKPNEDEEKLYLRSLNKLYDLI